MRNEGFFYSTNLFTFKFWNNVIDFCSSISQFLFCSIQCFHFGLILIHTLLNATTEFIFDCTDQWGLNMFFGNCVCSVIRWIVGLTPARKGKFIFMLPFAKGKIDFTHRTVHIIIAGTTWWWHCRRHIRWIATATRWAISGRIWWEIAKTIRWIWHEIVAGCRVW